jgi:hypothetical protein
MRVIEQHEAMDMILEYLVDNQNPDRPIHSSKIHHGLFPSSSIEETSLLLSRIMDTVDPVVVSRARNTEIADFDVFFQANAITERFLQQGGFTAIFEEQQKEMKVEEYYKLKSRNAIEDSIKMNRWNKIFLVINGLVALATLLIAIFKR